MSRTINIGLHKMTEADCYTRSNYEISSISSTRFTGYNQSMILRIRNLFLTSIINQKQLPLYVVVILEDDLLKFISYDDYGATVGYEKALGWICKEFNQIIKFIKNRMPAKAKKEGHPHFIWVTPSIHSNYTKANNDARKKFTLVMKDILKKPR